MPPPLTLSDHEYEEFMRAIGINPRTGEPLLDPRELEIEQLRKENELLWRKLDELQGVADEMAARRPRGRRGAGVDVAPARVVEARRTAKLSQADLARGVVSRSFVNQIERGISRPSPSVLRVIAERTGRPYAFFLAES